ncbi:hypothetical protein A7981_07355 [Methylovorus sp. MM2]|uniref:hypothetical protein n=1 Tax=Methylovorus sp. MM2 TaxID=1848038 RepID=UPI0007DF72D4|nr:hypothetical protein [Methylovorus sp. MM2]OAM53401.1 hypothetical protein A7981_07355 [Methylovorus sp. MM2]
MYSEEDLASAIKAGVLTDENVIAFRSHVAQLRSTPAVDEEHFRLVTGFNDIFVVIACALLLASVAWIGASVTPWFGGVTTSITAWLLAEFFTRKRRMALPSIFLLLAFIGGILMAGNVAMAKGSFVVASLIAVIAAWGHWRRFHVPITIAVGVATGAAFIVSLLIAVVPEMKNWTASISLIAGITIFFLAMRWDSEDTARQTRKSDVAFWLHLLAAPLLVHPVFALLGVWGGHISVAQAIAVVVLYVVIALVSLSIDRRALMVSALSYVLYTFSALFKQYGVVSLGFAITALAIGSALLLLSAFWHPSRMFVLQFLPFGLQKRLAPLS